MKAHNASSSVPAGLPAGLPSAAVAIIFLALAMTGIGLPMPTLARSVSFLLDVSESAGPAGAERARAAALSMIRDLPARDRVSLVAFAGKPILLSHPLPPDDAARLLEGVSLDLPGRDATDLAAALAAATGEAKSGRGKSLVALLSDGRVTAGGFPEVSAGPPVFALGLGVPAGGAAGGTMGDIVQGALSAPASARPGERVMLRWDLGAAWAGELEYSLRVDGMPVARGRASLERGANALPLEIDAGEAGLRSIEVAAILPDGGDGPAAGALLFVEGDSRVLVVGDGNGPSPIGPALRAQGFPVLDGGIGSLPEEVANYEGISAVVLDDVEALSLSGRQQDALIAWVEDGGGLLVVGGASSLGRGEYYATGLEEVLPVSTDERRRFFFTRAKLLFVIDRSGSMTEKVGGQTKQLAAMRGVAAAIAELGPQDEVGIIGFDSTAFWVLPFTPAGRASVAVDALSDMGEGGGTDLSQAIEEALRGFGEPGPTKRHIIVLSDGLTSSADFAGLSAKLGAARISVSTVGIGEEIDEELLRGIASMNGGEFYRAELDAVPMILDKETIRATRDLVREGNFSAIVTARSPLVEGLDGAPAVGGYLLTRLKDGAVMHLAVLDRAVADTAVAYAAVADASVADPLLATRRHGLGKVAVFTGDSGARWLKAWPGGPAYNRLWAQVVRSIEHPGPDRGLRASATVAGSVAHIVVTALDAERRSVSGLCLVGRIPGEASPPFPLRETATGRYEADVPLDGTGMRRFEIGDPTGASSTSAWVWNPQGPERSGAGPDLAALGLIASGSGGALLDAGDGNEARLPPSSWAWTTVDSRVAFVTLALLVFLAELVRRSAVIGLFPAARRALGAWWVARNAEARSMKTAWQREEEDDEAV